MQATSTLLLDAVKPYDLSDFTWDNDRNLYTYKNGTKVPDRVIFLAIDRHNKRVASDMRSHLTTNQGNLDRWEQRMKEEIRANHQTLLEFGRGGKGKVSQGDRAKVEKYLREVEFPALAQFKQAIAEGRVSEPRIKARIQAYADHGKVSYEEGVRVRYRAQGIRRGKRMLGNCKNHCIDCVRYANMGWQPISEIVLPGDKCLCLANCCCYILYE
jgi:hypothetical protein